MSTWTHVAGIIRFDGVLDMIPKPDLKESSIPTGSEGGLTISQWENPEPSSAAKWAVSIFGDLRDYDDEDEIAAYFESITSGKGVMVRQATFTVYVGGRQSRTFTYDFDLGGFIEQGKG